MNIADKITLLNRTTLESFNEVNELNIIASFSETGLKILNADFGFSYWKEGQEKNYNLVYTSPNITFQPRLPRDDGYTSKVDQSKQPYMGLVKKEKNPEYDFSPYMKSIIIVPVFYKNSKYGNIVLCFNYEKEFNEEDKGLSASLGNAAAQAITIHRLVKSEQESRVIAEALEARFRSLIENSYDVITLLSQQSEILYISPSVSKVSGYTVEELRGRNFNDYIHPEDFSLFNKGIKETLTKVDVIQHLEFRYRHKDDSWRWLESTIVNMLDNPSVRSLVVNIRDITERKIAQDTILHQSLHDALTNLPNRKEFEIRLDQVLESAKRHKRMFALMFLDMDRFKNINDTLGHIVGDTLLKVMATRFIACVRKEDTVARFGGDEFLILLNEINSSQDAAVMAEKILKATSVPVQIGQHNFHPSVSIGIAIYPHDGENLENLKKHADVALYRAKANGKNCYSLYDHSMYTYAAEKFALENELRKAMESNEIILYYQPIINLKTGKVVSMEALARWRHPSKGLLLPGDFIPLAEETGLILTLSNYILKAACRQQQVWKALGLPKFRVVINLSAQSFAESSFIAHIAKVLEEYGIDPDCLELEMTESAAMGNLDLTSFNLKELKKMGIHITIDDFGTGYSSLSYLKRFPLHNLKIDRSFVRHCITNEQDASIVRTIISIAHNLNLKVIAEGVETDQQLVFLTSLGCDSAQGFYISHPIPGEEVFLWLEKKYFKVQKTKKKAAVVKV